MLSRSLVLLFTASLALQAVAGETPDRNTFLPDDRVEADLEAARYSKVVRVGYGCTGAMVGLNLVLTAAHCIDHLYQEVLNPATQAMERRQTHRAVVFAKYRAGQYQAYAYGSKISMDMSYFTASNKNGVDWAIIQLDTNLADEAGISYFGTLAELPSESDYNHGLTLAGYSSDRESGTVLTTHEGCKIRSHQDGDNRLYHDCDMARGASGASLFKCSNDALGREQCYVVAVNVAEYRDADTSMHVPDSSYWQRRNVAVNARAWSGEVARLRALYPNGAPPPPAPTPVQTPVQNP